MHQIRTRYQIARTLSSARDLWFNVASMLANLKTRFAALRRPPFRRYWLGSFASVGATQLLTMGQGWLVFRLSGSALDLGYLGASASIPAIIMTLFGGALADRFDKRWIIMTASLLSGSLLLLLAVLDFSGTVEVWHVLAIAAVFSLISGVDWPTRQALFPALIEREDMMSAVSLNSIIWQSCRMVMPAAGGVIIAVFDTWVVFLLCSLGFYWMYFVILTLDVHSPRSEGGSTLGQIAEGIRFIFNTELFALLISLSFISMFFGTSYMQLMPAFAALLGAGEQGYGYLLSATGVGSVVGTFLIGAFQNSRRLGHIMLGCALVASTTLYLFATVAALADSLPGAFALALVTVFTIAMFSSMFLVTSMTVMQLEVPDRLRGRVMGIHGITYSLMPLGALVGGALASVSSAPAAVAVMVSVYVLFVLYLIGFRGRIRNIDGRELN